MEKSFAIVLGLCPNGLGVVRSLGRMGIPVKGFDYKSGGPGFYSKYAETGLCPNPYLEPDQLCEFLLGQGKILDDKGIFFPTSDEFVLFLSRYRSELSPFFHLALPSAEIIEALLNKRWQYDMAKEHGVPIPQTFYPATKKDIAEIVAAAHYPVIIKPCQTFIWKEKGFKTKGYRANDKLSLERILLFVLDKNVEVIVQSLIPGSVESFHEVCCYLSIESRPLALFIKKKIRQFPNEMGLGSMMESVRDNNLAAMTLKLFQGIHYHGVGEVEYKKDPRDGLYKMIEINARLTLQNRLADYCGINLPYTQYLDILGRLDDRLNMDYPEGKKWLWAEIDFESFKELYRHNRINLKQWMASILKVHVEAVFSARDPYPFFKTIIIDRFVKRVLNYTKF